MSPKNPETPVRIETEIDFRQKVGLSGSPISLDWKKDRVIETTEGDLARLRADISGQSSADDKQKAAEAFLRAQEKEEAEGDISDRLTAELWNGVKDKLIKSGVVTGALASGAALAHVASAKIEESTGIKMNLWDKFQSWAREEHKTATGIRKWILGLIAGKGKEESPSTEDAGMKAEKAQQDAESFLSAKSYDVTTKILIYWVAREKFDTALSAAIKWVSDATWWLDDVKKKEEVMSKAIIILSQSDVKKLSWSQVEALWEVWLLEKVGWASPRNKAAVKLIFLMLGNHQADRLTKVFHPDDWKKIPLEKVMATLYKREWHDKIEGLTDRIKGIDLTKISELPKSIFLSFWKDGAGREQIEWLLKGDVDSLKWQWINIGFIGKIISIQSGTQKIGEFAEYIKKEPLSPAEKVFIEKILNKENFLNPLRESLRTRFGFTEWLMELISQKNLSMKDLTEMYILTQWSPDITTMTKWRRALLFTKLQMIFVWESPAAFWEYMNKLVKEGSARYPDALEVWSMVDSVINYSVYKTTFASIQWGEQFLTGLLSVLWLKVDSRTALALGGLGGIWGLIWLAIKLSPIWRVASIVALLAWSLGIAGFTIAQGISKK